MKEKIGLMELRSEVMRIFAAQTTAPGEIEVRNSGRLAASDATTEVTLKFDRQ